MAAGLLEPCASAAADCAPCTWPADPPGSAVVVTTVCGARATVTNTSWSAAITRNGAYRRAMGISSPPGGRLPAAIRCQKRRSGRGYDWSGELDNECVPRPRGVARADRAAV